MSKLIAILIVFALGGYFLLRYPQQLLYKTDIDAMRASPDRWQYVIAGFEYARWVNPTTFDTTQPPLGKYLIGLSYRFNHRTYTFSWLAMIGSVWLMYKLVKKITENEVLALIAELVLVAAWIYAAKIVVTGRLEVFTLFFSLVFLNILFSKFNNEYLWAGLVGAALAAVVATQYWPVWWAVLLILLVVRLIRKSNLVFNLAIIFGVFIASYLLVYIVHFGQGGGVWDLVIYERRRLLWWWVEIKK